MIILLGAVIGLAVGIILCLIQQHVGVIRMPGSFVIEYYPVVIKPGDILLTLGGIALIGLLITALPTRRTLSRILDRIAPAPSIFIPQTVLFPSCTTRPLRGNSPLFLHTGRISGYSVPMRSPISVTRDA